MTFSTVPGGAPEIIAAETARFGALGVETGGFLLSAAGSDEPSVVALAGERGITRHPRLLEISALALDRLFRFADAERLRVRVQFHSHRDEAFLSVTDKELGLRVPEFISAVIPTFADPPTDPRSWGWWMFDGREWVEVAPLPLGSGLPRVAVFDEDGTRDA